MSETITVTAGDEKIWFPMIREIRNRLGLGILHIPKNGNGGGNERGDDNDNDARPTSIQDIFDRVRNKINTFRSE